MGLEYRLRCREVFVVERASRLTKRAREEKGHFDQENTLAHNYEQGKSLDM